MLCFFCLRLQAAEEPLVWIDCVREAAKNQPDLIAALEQVKASQAQQGITASRLYPQVNSSLSASTAKTSSTSSSGVISSSTKDSYSYGVTGTQLIFDGFKTVNQVNAAGQNVAAAQDNFSYTSASVRYRLRSAFVNLLTAQEMLRITKEIYDIRRDNLQLITLRYESGLEHRGALLTAQSDLADAEYGIAQAQRSVVVAQRKLAKEMGREKPGAFVARGDFQVIAPTQEKPDLDAITRKHPSLLQAVAQKNAAQFNLRAAYANFIPALKGRAGANKSGAKWEPRGNQWNLGLTLTLQIFEGGLRVEQVKQAQAQLDKLVAKRSTRDGLTLTLEQTWAALKDALDNEEVQRQVLAATQERSKIGQEQYSIGFMNFDNWIIVEDNLVKAKKSYIAAQSASLAAEAAWVQAKGETLEYA